MSEPEKIANALAAVDAAKKRIKIKLKPKEGKEAAK